MPKVSEASATQGGDYGIVLDRAEQLEGYTVNFVTFREDIDHTPLLKGLPDDQCQSPHWGYVIKGRLTFRCTTSQAANTCSSARLPNCARPARSSCRTCRLCRPAEQSRRWTQARADAGKPSSGRRPCCIANRPAAARVGALIFA